MSDAEWDADDFKPPEMDAGAGKKTNDKWEGEDEDDDVKASWDASDSDSEKKDDGSDPQAKAVQRKKKKKLADIIAEKEAAKAADLDQRAATEAAKKQMNTPEAKLAEKLRLQKMEENANLQMAKDMFGVKSGSIDSMIPVTKAEFDQLEKAISEKLSQHVSSELYNDFVASLVKNLCLDLNVTTLKKIKMDVEALHSTKLKEETAAKKKKAGKKAGTVRMDTDKDIYGNAGAGGYDDMDDFM